VTGAVDVHAAQWGNVSRALAVVAAGLAPEAVAIDEGTLLLSNGAVAGAGRVWHVTPDTATPGGALVRARVAGQ
jgi:cyanophycinase